MQLKFISILVRNQEEALQFYTQKLGFTKMADIDMGQYRWLTVVSPDGIEGVELVLEPMKFSPAQVYQRALFEAGTPALALISQNLAADVLRLKAQGVVFRGEPRSEGVITSILFEDGCGNLIHLVQPMD